MTVRGVVGVDVMSTGDAVSARDVVGADVTTKHVSRALQKMRLEISAETSWTSALHWNVNHTVEWGQTFRPNEFECVLRKRQKSREMHDI